MSCLNLIRAASVVVILGLAVAANAEPRTTETKWFEDSTAGVKVPLPQPLIDPRVKNTSQLRELVKGHSPVSFPVGTSLTSGLYARDGLPYLLIWTIKTATADVDHMVDVQGIDQGAPGFNWTVSKDQTRASGTLRLAADGLNVHALVQLVQGGAVYLTYYSGLADDAKAFDEISQGLTLTTAKAVATKQAPFGALWLRAGLAVAVFILVWAAMTLAGMTRALRENRLKR